MIENFISKQSARIGVDSLNRLINSIDRIKKAKKVIETKENLKTITNKNKKYGKYN